MEETRMTKKELAKQYYQKNREKMLLQIKEKQKESTVCPACKCEVKNGYISRHLKTRKHLDNVNEAIDNENSDRVLLRKIISNALNEMMLK